MDFVWFCNYPCIDHWDFFTECATRVAYWIGIGIVGRRFNKKKIKQCDYESMWQFAGELF